MGGKEEGGFTLSFYEIEAPARPEKADTPAASSTAPIPFYRKSLGSASPGDRHAGRNWVSWGEIGGTP